MTGTRDIRVLITPRLPPGLLHFVSGASASADLRGLSRCLVPAGISLPELSAPMLDELVSLRHLPWRIFVDTGAFGEVEMVDGRPVVVAPIDEPTWHRRLAMSLRIAEAFGPRAYVVAPDCVGDQVETLARLRRHRDEVRALRATGAGVVVAHQRGAMTTAAFGRAAAELLGFDDFVPALPGNKDAMPPDEAEAFLREARPAALHILGVGPRSPRLPPLLDLCRRLIPGARVSCDSNALAALVGQTNGPGGGPRPLTATQAFFASGGSERAREDAVAWAFGINAYIWRYRALLEEEGLAPMPPEPVLQMGLFDVLGRAG